MYLRRTFCRCSQSNSVVVISEWKYCITVFHYWLCTEVTFLLHTKSIDSGENSTCYSPMSQSIKMHRNNFSLVRYIFKAHNFNKVRCIWKKKKLTIVQCLSPVFLNIALKNIYAVLWENIHPYTLWFLATWKSPSFKPGLVRIWDKHYVHWVKEIATNR